MILPEGIVLFIVAQVIRIFSDFAGAPLYSYTALPGGTGGVKTLYDFDKICRQGF